MQISTWKAGLADLNKKKKLQEAVWKKAIILFSWFVFFCLILVEYFALFAFEQSCSWFKNAHCSVIILTEIKV